MADTIKVDLDGNSHYRVAFDLALKIAHGEGKQMGEGREYWLKLYKSCRMIVAEGRTVEQSMGQE